MHRLWAAAYGRPPSISPPPHIRGSTALLISLSLECAFANSHSLPSFIYSPVMASKVPLPAPPRTPTPPPDENAPQPVGLGFRSDLAVGDMGPNNNALLSPMSATFPSKQYATLGPSDSVSQRASPATLYTPASATFPYTPASDSTMNLDAPPSINGSENPNPFNFQSVAYQPGRPQTKANVRSCIPLHALLLTYVGYRPKTGTQVQAQ
jgi:hypothetical protein